jgi:GcrA cell cycle regulator
MSWTPKRVSKLKELWGKGNTASEIASIIGEVTRNAVIGKAYRLKLTEKSFSRNIDLKKSSRNIENTPQPERKTRRSKFKSLLLDKNFESENPKSLEELTDDICKWPIGHPDELNFYFCGRKAMKDFSYCKLHVLYAFQPKNKKEELIKKEDGVPQFIEKKIKSA